MMMQTGFRWMAFSALASVWACASTGSGPGTETQTAFPPVSDTSIFAPLQQPPALSATRLADGAPGPKYWQNRADYQLRATLDTTNGVVEGSMVMRYTNNSPNTLDFIWVQTEQNAYRKGQTSAPEGFGYAIDQFTEIVDGAPQPVQLEDHKTETKVMLPTPLKPGSATTFEAKWHFVTPPPKFRMGREGSLYQIAQWYPRMNVYDDVKGWNIEPYLGDGEFYLEYGDFTLAVTVPSNYIVAATGTLDNPSDVLTPTEIARCALAKHADTTIHIVTEAELNDGSGHLKHDGMVTWKFHANNVRDEVWAAAPDYIWDATNWKGIPAQAFYRPAAASSWDKVADMAKMSIQEYSERWYPYPYPQVSVAEGPVQGGMEYPMISFDGAFPEFTEYEVVTHEIGHNWFPMIVGSNERIHAWMDEGLNTFINTFSEARRYPQNGDQTARGDKYRREIGGRIIQHNDLVMEVPPDGAPDIQYIAYDKPGGVLQMLRRDVMGPELFDKAFKLYIRRWAYKHPTPQDFYRTMASVAGRPLDWFWREWFLETPNFDQSVDSVTQTTQGKVTHIRVVYGNLARGVLPILARFTFSDGTTEDFTYSADSWRVNSTRYVVTYTFPHKTVSKIELDPDHHFIDTNRKNNAWTQP